MSFYLIKPCKSTAAFEAVPKDALKLELPELKDELTDLGFTLLADAGILLVLEKSGCEVSIYPTGKILIKVDDQAAAEKIVEDLEPILFPNEG